MVQSRLLELTGELNMTIDLERISVISIPNPFHVNPQYANQPAQVILMGGPVSLTLTIETAREVHAAWCRYRESTVLFWDENKFPEGLKDQ